MKRTKSIKRVIAALLCTVTILTGLPDFVTAQTTGTQQETEDISIKKYKGKESKVILSDFSEINYLVTVKMSNASKKTKEYGCSFYLQRYQKGNWKMVPMKEGIGFDAVAYSLPGKSSVTQSYSLLDYYKRSQLKKGTYRLYVSYDVKKSKRYVKFKITGDLVENQNIKKYKGTKTKVTVVDFSKKDDYTVTVKMCNASKNEKYYGNGFYLQRYQDGKWKTVPMKTDYSFTCEAYSIPSGYSVTKSYTLLNYYEKSQLKKGKYRLYVDYILKKPNCFARFTIQ